MWEWDTIWSDHFREVVAAANTHMEVMASAAVQSVHPSLLTQADLGRWAEDLEKLERETGYVPTLPSPLQWLALPAKFSAVGQVYDPKDGSPNRYGYGGIRVVIRLPLQKEGTRMYMLQRLDMPVSTGSTHQMIGPTEERTLIVQASGHGRR